MAKRAPQHLTAEARGIWKRLTEGWDFNEAERLTLKVALEAYDRLQGARAIIDAEGPTVTTPSGYLQPHPALRLEKEARGGFLQAWRLLDLAEQEIPEIGGHFGKAAKA